MDVRKKSQKQEKRVAKEINGKPTPASGALWGAKGDVKNKRYLVECKYTDRNFYTLTEAVWKKIRNEALNDGLRTALMCIDIQGESYAVIGLGDFNCYCTKPLADLKPELVQKKSFRIHKFKEPFVFSCRGWCLPNPNVSLQLLVIPWKDFKYFMGEELTRDE